MFSLEGDVACQQTKLKLPEQSLMGVQTQESQIQAAKGSVYVCFKGNAA